MCLGLDGSLGGGVMSQVDSPRQERRGALAVELRWE